MNMIKKKSLSNEDDFLIKPEIAYAVSIQVGDTGVTANSDGEKIIYAGTPLYIATGKSVLEDRDEVVTSSSTTGSVCGIARHDINVTNGTVNDAVLIAGGVDLYKLKDSVQTLITSDVKTALPYIHFQKGAK